MPIKKINFILQLAVSYKIIEPRDDFYLLSLFKIKFNYELQFEIIKFKI